MATTFDEEEDIMLPFSEEPSSPVRPKLKRLKKASEKQPSIHLAADRPPVNQTLPPDSSEEALDPLFPDSEGLVDELRKEAADRIIENEPLLPDSVEEEHVEDDSLDPLFPDSGGLMEALRREKLEEIKVRDTDSPSLEDESVDPDQDEMNDGLDPLFPEPGKYKAWGGEEIGEGGLMEELRKENSAKKRLNFGGDGESLEKETKKKRKKSKENADSKQKESSRDKRRFEKERRAQLGLLHVESQRLLRETSDASFKPVPVVHKPISSVLEKIRLRKLEILKKSSASFQTAESESWSVDASEVQNMAKDDMDLGMGGNGDQAMHARSSESALEGEKTSELHNNRENGSEKQNPNPDTSESTSDEEKFGTTHRSNGNHNQTQSENDVADNKVDEVPGSSMPCTKPAVPSNEVLSSSSDNEEEEEEYNDKENIDPFSRELFSVDDKNTKSAVLKDFLDEEAEEEDDSDHDLARFPENGEDDHDDDESDETEVLKDLIATGYKEGKRDHERRNELHLKWLEQQDAAETDNVLQRLKYSNLQKEDLMDEVEEEDEDEGEGSEDDAMLSDSGAGAGGPKNILRQNLEKAKQMMMFNDDHDVYVPSDEDENEDHFLRRRISKPGDTKITSPLEDEESKEVFGLIKKLNIAPPPKKRGNQATTNLDMLSVGRNSSSFSKFFGRKASSSMSSSRKAVIGRSFIFGRDDSNSRSGLSTDDQSSENNDQSHMDPKEKDQMRKPTSANLRSSQLKSATVANSGVNSSSGSSLFEILRRSSISSDEQTEDKNQMTESQATYIYSAFKVGRGFSRVDSKF
ncbi:DNA ligase-like protein [Rhynchospora pubera]|uniref:DNA ligase-like protein n=1 Tax=Rhynchospora pubera TaxID=906938 RepID=A0AAV8G866_9POAL|nr:DNA ligase-like protein [Rhynchospora pubera]KAJ4801269.1 DNA ligase-like protein [Rhynchospora pubera]